MPLVLDSPVVTYGSGAAEALPGSRLVVPSSVTLTTYDVNGLILNARNNLEHYWIDSIDGLYDAEVRDNREPNADRDGEQYLGGLYSGKPVVINGKIKAQTIWKLEDMEFALTEAFDSLDGEYPIIARTGNFERDWVFYAVKTAPISLRQEQDSYQFKRPFMITLRCSKPNLFSYQLHQVSVNLNTQTTIEVNNKGNKQASPRFLLFGQQTDVEIYNPATLQTFKLTGTIPAGRYWEVDFEEGTIIDDLGVNKFDAYDPTSDWLKLAKRSTQVLQITSTGKNASAAATVYWRDTYK